MTILPADDHAREMYDTFADFYDLFTAHHDYEVWTLALEQLAHAAGLRGDRLLDVACGTGKSLVPFLARGYHVTGCDVSPAMLRHAASKTDGDVRLAVHDMRRLPVLGTFDLVCCLDDAVNYLLTHADVVALLRGVRDNLAPDGVAIFDVNSVRSYRTFYGSLTVVPGDDRVVVWDGRVPQTFGDGDLAHVAIEMFERCDDGPWRRAQAHHHQRHHPTQMLRRAITAAGLECVALHGMQLDGSFEAGFAEDGNSKAVYVLRRAGR